MMGGLSNLLKQEITDAKAQEKFRCMKYMRNFLELRCSPDVLLSVNPINNPVKEISESMSVIRRLKPITLDKDSKGKYTLYDLCAGNALTSVLAAHTLPLKETIAIDKDKRKRNWERTERFSYLEKNIYDLKEDDFVEDSIIIGVHACGNLAEKIIELYHESPAKHLVLMPCCDGKRDKKYRFLEKKGDTYTAWACHLNDKADGTMILDKNVLSPKNAVITASKK